MPSSQISGRHGGDSSAIEPRELAKAAPSAHVLVVDDDDGACRALEKLMRAEGYTTSTAPDGEAALAATRRVLPDVVLTDLHMPGIHGVDLCRRLHAIDHDLPVILITADSDMHSVVESMRAGAEDYLVKPLHYDAVLWAVERAIARRIAKREQEALQRTLNERLVMSSIRAQELAEAEARHRAQLTALLENLSEGVAIGDSSGAVLMLNKPAREILGVDNEGLGDIQANPPEACDLEGRPLSVEQRPLIRASRGEQFMDYEVTYRRTGGERRRVVFTGTSVKGANGGVELAIVLFRDVTQVRRLEQERDEYVSLLSHDLRNPLSVVLMSVSVLKRSMGTTSPVDVTERLERNAKRMNRMLNELTEATTLESQGGALRRVACDLREVVAGAVDSLEGERARQITIETDAAASYVVLAEVSRLERVVANLLTNALKYSAEDAPVTARLSGGARDVVLEVIDSGIGIAPASVERLFERYYRTQAGKARASGLGLGLYIARLIVQAHGGRLDVSSEAGSGTTFTLTLPSHAPEA